MIILRLYLEGGVLRDVAARTVCDHETGITSLVVDDLPAELAGMTVLGFSLTASVSDPLVLASGDTLTLTLPPAITR